MDVTDYPDLAAPASNPLVDPRSATPELTPLQATHDAIAALKTAGLGNENERPVEVSSWRERWHMQGQDYIRTEATPSRAADRDAVLRALILLPDCEACDNQINRQITIWRRTRPGKEPRP